MRSPLSKNAVFSLEDLKEIESKKAFRASMGGDPGGMGNRNTPGISAFTPQYHDLLYNNLAQFHTPKARNLYNMLMSQIYNYDTIAGPAVDLYAEMPWSSFELTGIQDRYVLQKYEDALANLKLEYYMPMISATYLVFGRVCLHFLFDQTQGIWSNLIIHDDSNLSVKPVPFLNEEPLVDLIPSKALLDFVSSKDPRTEVYKQYLSDDLMAQIKAGRSIPLDPANTLYLPKRRLPSDFIGTSIFSRIIGLVVLERALFNASTAKAQRGAGSIRLVKVGRTGADGWMPTDDEVNSIIQSMMVAEEDPAASIVGVKTQDVTVETIAGSGKEALWSIADDADYIQNAKFKALGINEELINGSATYNNMEQALSVFLDKIRHFRDYLTRKVIVEKALEPIAKAHGFYHKDTKGFNPSSVYNRRGDDSRSLKDIQDSKLMLPTIQWHKPLEPRMDQSLIDLYKVAEEVGLPISLRRWSVAVGANLSDIKKEAHEDLRDRKEMAKILQEREALGVGDSSSLSEDDMGEDFGGPGGPGGAPGGDEGGGTMEESPVEMDKVSPSDHSVVDGVPPPPGGEPAATKNRLNINTHPLATKTGFCGVNWTKIRAFSKLDSVERREILRAMTVKDRAVIKYALTYSGDETLNQEEIGIIAKLFPKNASMNKAHIAHLYANKSHDASLLTGIE
jgi:plasmid stability protein